MMVKKLMYYLKIIVFQLRSRKNCKFVVNINSLNKAGFNIDGKYNFLLDSGERTVKRNIY